MTKWRFLAVIALMLAAIMGIQTLACVPDWKFSGFYRERCRSNECGAFWVEPQLYYVEIWESDCADEDGNYTKEGEWTSAGFGVCC